MPLAANTAGEKRQRADDDYVSTQESLAQATEVQQELHKKIRAVKDEARLGLDRHRGYRLDGMTLKELEVREMS